MDIAHILSLYNNSGANFSMNATQLSDTASMLSCVPVCAKMGFEHIVVAMWSLLGVIVTGISTVATAHYRLKQKELEIKARQHDEMLKVQVEKLEVSKSMSPKSHTPPSTNDSARYMRMRRLLTMFAAVGSHTDDTEPLHDPTNT